MASRVRPETQALIDAAQHTVEWLSEVFATSREGGFTKVSLEYADARARQRELEDAIAAIAGGT